MSSYIRTFIDRFPHYIGQVVQRNLFHLYWSNHLMQVHDGYSSVVLYGGGGADTIYGNGLCNDLHGGAGNDVIQIWFGLSNNVYGDAGNDTLKGWSSNDYLDGGAGDDHIAGNAGADTIRGGAGNDKMWGGSGDDDIEDEQGANTVYGDDGRDTIVSSSRSKLFGGTGNDMIFAGDQCSVSGGPGDDAIYGFFAHGVIAGDEGADSIFGASFATISGGDGDDLIRSGSSPGIWIDGNAGDDTIVASGGGHISGGLGADRLEFDRQYHGVAFVSYQHMADSSSEHPDTVVGALVRYQFFNLDPLLHTFDHSAATRWDRIVGHDLFWPDDDRTDAAGAMHLSPPGGDTRTFYFWNVEIGSNAVKRFQINFESSTIDRSNFLY